MSSYVASYCMCCRVDSSVSGTSDSWPAATVAPWFRFANSCSPMHHPLCPGLCHPTLIPAAQRLRFAPTRVAAALCSSSRNLPPPILGTLLRRHPTQPAILTPLHCRPATACTTAEHL